MANKFLGQAVEKLEVAGALHTAREIACQPGLWINTWKKINSEKETLHQFLEPILSLSDLDIVLTGAGTSAFIGEVAEPLLNQLWPHSVRAIPTTTLVTHFDYYVEKDKPLLLISFARSGNSPESKATIQLAEDFCQQELFHLVITCNPEGELTRAVPDAKSYIFLLPPEAEDKSLAMTGSFTSMLLAILLMGRVGDDGNPGPDVQRLAQMGRSFIDEYTSQIEEQANLDFHRAVFLGSGPRLGIARESHLKLQELTDGRIICKYDSFLGFRHGPKAVIDDHTLLIYLFSKDPHVLKYERDLAKSISNKDLGLASIGVGAGLNPEIKGSFNMEFKRLGSLKANSLLLPILSVLPAQLLGFFASLKYGLKPDSPSARGAISRVVEGVEIYDRSDA